MAAENVDLAAGHSKMLAVLVVGRGGAAVADFGGGKGPNGMSKISTFGVLRLRATKPYVTR
jgi:hypothetical protein